MDWYYAVGEERKGPLSEAEFQSLVQQGVVTRQTLVWREGMANWQPYDGGTPPPPTPGNATAGGVVCSGCGRIFPGTDVISLSGALYCAACKPLALQRLKEEGATGSTAAEEMRKEHLKHEASVKSVGVLYYLGGGAVFLFGLVGLFAVPKDSNAPIAIVVFPVLLLFLFGAGQLWVGTGLRRLRRWARIPTGILSSIGLLGFPIGTIINGYILYLIFSQKGKVVFSDEYQAVIEQTPHIKYRTSIVVWIVLGMLLLLIAAGIIAAVIGTA